MKLGRAQKESVSGGEKLFWMRSRVRSVGKRALARCRAGAPGSLKRASVSAQ